MRILATFLCLGLSTGALAQEKDFEEGSEARSWNLYGEIPARFEATVVDMLCEITGDCAENCGDGARQLGLLRSVDDVLIFPNKNSQAAFTGATQELLPFCGQLVEVDGLIIEDDFVGAVNIYLLQTIRVVGDPDWIKANSWTSVWAENNPDSAGNGPWFRRDPRVAAEIASEGYFGLGLEADTEIKDQVWP